MKNQMAERLQALSSILHGCELAKELETKLPTLSNQPNDLFSSCEEICRAFNKAMNLLNPHHSASYTRTIFGGPSESSSTAQNMERGVYKPDMDLLFLHTLAASNPFDVHMLAARNIGAMEPLSSATVVKLGTDMGRVNAGDADAFAPSRPGGELQASGSSDSGGSSMGGTLVQRPRRRKDSHEVRTIRVSAPRTGNLEIPPDDGFTWRKYGQKDILNSKFPRSYYRCTHKIFYGCDAKKQAQRLDDDPFTFEVMYRGHHTCQTCPTPLILPSLDTTKQEMIETTQPSPVSTSIHLGLFSREQRDKNTLRDQHQHVPIHAGGESSSSQLEPSHVQGGKEMEFPVMDLAAAMFNYGSSSTNMDTIFPSEKEN